MPIINRIKQYFVTLTHILFKDKCILLLELRSLHNREPSSFLIQITQYPSSSNRRFYTQMFPVRGRSQSTTLLTTKSVFYRFSFHCIQQDFVRKVLIDEGELI